MFLVHSITVCLLVLKCNYFLALQVEKPSTNRLMFIWVHVFNELLLLNSGCGKNINQLDYTYLETLFLVWQKAIYKCLHYYEYIKCNLG